MANIRVTPDQLDGTAAIVQSGAGKIESELQRLAAEISPLAGDWAGMAQTRFESLWIEWQNSARSLNEALTGVAQLLSAAGAHYAEAESAIAASFGVM